MRKKRFLAAILLVVVFCFVVSGAGYGEIKEWTLERKIRFIDLFLAEAELAYIFRNKTNYLDATFSYDNVYEGEVIFSSKHDVSTKGKILIQIRDSRGIFSNKSEIAILNLFNKALGAMYSFIENYATDMDADVVAIVRDDQGHKLAYFYEGEYHLWEE